MFQEAGNRGIKHDELLEMSGYIRKYGFSKKSLKHSARRNKKVKADLKVTDLELVVLVPFIINSTTDLSVQDLIRYAQADSSVTMELYKTLFDLAGKGFLRIKSGVADVSFYISPELYNYFQTGEFTVIDEKGSLKSVIREVDNIANLYNHRIDMVSRMGEKEIIKILERNSDLSFCRDLLELKRRSDNECSEIYKFAYYMVGHLILNVNQMDRDNDLMYMFCAHDKLREAIIDEVFLDEKNLLFEMKIFQRGIDDSGKADKNKIEIHSDFKRKHLMDVMRDRKLDDLIESGKITEKKLFFNRKNEEQIEDLLSILETDKLVEVRGRLKSQGSKGGFTCLFMGHAGVGKTETAYQIARRTGRDIIKVDMSTIRSKWWGEDEKNVKAIFTNYKSAVKEARIEPILLLNEADAIIGKRLDVTGHNGALLSSINATQNIILEEMENFEGIMIATTNLTSNMDSAFERRFLYKVDFEKPNRETRAKLYENILKISPGEAMILAEEFDLTGGQIENVMKKKTVNYVLKNEMGNLDAIRAICRDERINAGKMIGFGQ